MNYVLDCVVALWEGPQLLLAKVKDAHGQDSLVYLNIETAHCYIQNYWRHILLSGDDFITFDEMVHHLHIGKHGNMLAWYLKKTNFKPNNQKVALVMYSQY